MYHLKQIPSETKIKKFLRSILFGKNVFCPLCKSWNVISRQERYYCSKCRKRFSLLSHTWLANMKIPLTQFWLILWCWTKQIPVKQTQDLATLSEKGVRYWFDSFRVHLPHQQEILEHIIQLDEAYFGHFKSFDMEFKGVALMMGKQIGSRKLVYRIISDNAPSKIDAINFLKSSVRENSQLNTDGARIYKNISRYFPVTHKSDIHIKYEFKNTSEIEGMFGNLRTFFRRMYHHVSIEKFPEYMLEFHFRFSRPEMFQSPYQYLLNTLHLVPTG